MTTTKFIWATWLVDAGANLAQYFTDESECRPYIHAFESEDDEDGEGYHMSDEGAQFYVEPTIHAQTCGERVVRFVMMVPDVGGYGELDAPAFSPGELGGKDAQEFGVDTAEDIAQAIEKLETI